LVSQARVTILNTKREQFLINKVFFPFASFIIFLGIIVDASKDNSSIDKQFKSDLVIYNKLLEKSPYQLNNDIRIEIQSIEQINSTKRKSKEVNGKIFLSNAEYEVLNERKLIGMNFLCTNIETTKLLSNDYILHFYVITKVKNKYTTLNKILDGFNLKKLDCQNNKNYDLQRNQLTKN
jgi:hypothetical protein